MASITAPAATVPLFNIVFDSWFGGGRKKPAPPRESPYKKRIDCLNNLVRIQGNLRWADEEYSNVSIIEGKPHKSALNLMEVSTKEYRDTWEKCEAIIKP